MSWGFDLMEDIYKSKWMEWVTGYTLKRSTFFTSDAMVTRDKAVSYGMDPEKTVVFPWGVDLDHFSPPSTIHPNTSRAGGPQSGFTLFFYRSWEANYGAALLAKAFVLLSAPP